MSQSKTIRLSDNELWAIRSAAAIVRAHASQIPARLGYHAEKCEANLIAMTLECLLDRHSPTGEKQPQNDKDQERRTMSDDNTRDGAEPSLASVGSVFRGVVQVVQNMSRNAQGPRSSRGSSIRKSDRKRLERLDRRIAWLDARMASVLVWFDKKEYARLDTKRASMDRQRKELRLRMKGKAVGKNKQNASDQQHRTQERP